MSLQTDPATPRTPPATLGETGARGLLVVLGIVVGVIVLGAIRVAGSITENIPPARSRVAVTLRVPPTMHTVVYRVGGTASSASLTIRYATGGTDQIDVSLPWQTSFRFRSGALMYVSAQKSNVAGTVSCTITSDTEVVQRAQSDSAHDSVICSGIA